MQVNFEMIEKESLKMETLSKVEESERRHDAWFHAKSFFKRPAYFGTELEARTYEEQKNV